MALYHVVAQGEEYTDKAGNRKRHSNTIGIVVKTKNGMMLKLTSIPVGWDGWAYLNEPNELKDKGRENNQQSGQRNQGDARERQQPQRQANRGYGGGYPSRDDMEDDVPF